MKNIKLFSRAILLLFGLFVLPLFVQSAHADTLDFHCVSLVACNGTITDVFSGGVFVSSSDLSGVTLVNDIGPADDQGLSFTFLYDTTLSSPNIALSENGGDGSILAGTIVAASGSQAGGLDNIVLTVVWTGMSADFATFLGSSTGIGFADNIILSVGGSADLVQVGIAPTPEPGSLLLLGSGILSFGGLLRRKIFKA